MGQPSVRHNRSTLCLLLGIVALCGAAGAAWGAEAPVSNSQAELQRLTAEMASKEPERIKAAIPQIHTFIAASKDRSADIADAVRLLMSAKSYEGVDQIAVETALAYPTQCEWLLKQRVTALLGLGKKEEALAAAKVYYNVVSLDQTMDAISTVSLALLAARPEDKDIVRRFKKEQLAGSTTQPATTPTTSPQTVLDSIKVDGKVFQDAADKINLDDAFSYLRKGNLLLMAGNGKEAREVFEQAKAIVDGNKLGDAISNVARAIRTENGCVGPANTYILKMRENPDQ